MKSKTPNGIHIAAKNANITSPSKNNLNHHHIALFQNRRINFASIARLYRPSVLNPFEYATCTNAIKGITIKQKIKPILDRFDKEIDITR